MSKIDKIEDLLAWSNSMDLVKEVYLVTAKGKLSKDFTLCNQIRKSAISIPSNIAEGFGRGGNKEFVNFLSIAKGSTYELKTQLMIANQIGFINNEILKQLTEKTDTISKIITGLIQYLQKSEKKGPKYNN